MPAVTVYCSSSSYLDPQFHDAAKLIGAELGKRGITLVYGGGSVGLMGELARSAHEHGGCVVGIITKMLHELERAQEGCNELIVVETMRERKHLLADRGDAFLILPGGVGTYEEFFEILVGRLLGEHAKPIGVVNAHGYYNPLIAMIEHGIEHRFIQPALRGLFTIDPDPLTVLQGLLDHQPSAIDFERMAPSGRAETQ